MISYDTICTSLLELHDMSAELPAAAAAAAAAASTSSGRVIVMGDR